MSFHMCLQVACPKRGIVTLDVFVWFFPTVEFQMCFQRCSLWWQLFQCLTSFCHVFLFFAVLELNFSFLLLQPKISFLSDIDNFNVMSHIIANREKGDLSPGMWYAIFVLSYFINDGLLQVTTLIHTTLLIGQNHYCHHHHMNDLMTIITTIWMISLISFIKLN